jgi:hypothetical protein
LALETELARVTRLGEDALKELGPESTAAETGSHAQYDVRVGRAERHRPSIIRTDQRPKTTALLIPLDLNEIVPQAVVGFTLVLTLQPFADLGEV